MKLFATVSAVLMASSSTVVVTTIGRPACRTNTRSMGVNAYSPAIRKMKCMCTYGSPRSRFSHAARQVGTHPV